MQPTSLLIATCLALALALALAPALAETEAPPLPVVTGPEAAEGTLGLSKLEQLVAPVALYPDQLLADVLAASTYPAQIVDAQRFVDDPARAGLNGAALTEAAAQKNWDPSVTALLMFQPVLKMMNSNLPWTEHLGHAFITQQADVMNTIQVLRQQAERAGTLANGPYESVANEGTDIVIGPPSQQDVYVPTYQPQCVFGPDPDCDGMDTGIYWSSDISLPYGLLPWAHLDWRAHEIRIDRSIGHDRLGGMASAGADDLSGVWHHAMGRHDLAASITGHPGAFNYAPSADMPFGTRARFAGLGGTPAHFSAPATMHGLPLHTATAFHGPRSMALPHTAGMSHGTGGFGHR